ncbi:hypothetical protein ONZ45_g4952 [Pleurotus djamor]|nr:hypothetical protein ONZ45_g4952 [Pleurotus djamor]
MSHKFPVTEDSDDALEAQKALNAVFERAPTRRFRKERERALSHTPKAALLSLLITKEYASRQTRQLLDATLSQLSESTRRLTLAESSDTPKTRYTSDLSPQLSEKVLRSLSDAQEAAARAQSNVNAYKLQLEEAQKEIFRAQEVLRDVERQRDEAERKAAEAREVARQMREEQLFIVAREEGRRSGFEDGFEHGKQVAKAHRERRRAIEAEHRRSRRRMIEDVKPEPPPTAQATPASEAPIPVPPPISQLEEPPRPAATSATFHP